MTAERPTRLGADWETNVTVRRGRADTMAVFAIGPNRTDSGGYGGSSPRKIAA